MSEGQSSKSVDQLPPPRSLRMGSGPIHTSQTKTLAFMPCLETHELLTRPSKYRENGIHLFPMPTFFDSYSLLLSSCFLPSSLLILLCATFLFKPGREQNEVRVT